MANGAGTDNDEYTDNDSNDYDEFGNDEGATTKIGGPLIFLSKNIFALNAIFRIVSCLCIKCDLTCLILLKNSTQPEL